MKWKLTCYGCDYTETLRNRELRECPECQSTAIDYLPLSESNVSRVPSDWSTTMLFRVIFGVISVILLISGIILTVVDVGLPGIPLPWSGGVIYLNALGITFLVVGFIILVILTQGEFIECCLGG